MKARMSPKFKSFLKTKNGKNSLRNLLVTAFKESSEDEVGFVISDKEGKKYKLTYAQRKELISTSK